MDFSNNSNPFMSVYREMLGKIYQQYLYHSGKREYQLQKAISYGDFSSPLFSSQPYLSTSSSPLSPPNETSSIDAILAQDSREVFDKVKNTALSIAYRIKIHNNINYQLDCNWYAAKKEFLALEQFYPGRDRGSERRRSMLTSDLFRIYKNMMDEELQCWKDLQEPMRYFIHLFHQYKGLKQDKRMIEEK